MALDVPRTLGLARRTARTQVAATADLDLVWAFVRGLSRATLAARTLLYRTDTGVTDTRVIFFFIRHLAHLAPVYPTVLLTAYPESAVSDLPPLSKPQTSKRYAKRRTHVDSSAAVL
jgi:hypothetical protein